jgi:hypothetical protein
MHLHDLTTIFVNMHLLLCANANEDERCVFVLRYLAPAAASPGVCMRKCFTCHPPTCPDEHFLRFAMPLSLTS